MRWRCPWNNLLICTDYDHQIVCSCENIIKNQCLLLIHFRVMISIAIERDNVEKEEEFEKCALKYRKRKHNGNFDRQIEFNKNRF